MNKSICKNFLKKVRCEFSIGCFILIVICLPSCKKYLDQKPNQQLAIPATLDDLEALLNNYESINIRNPSLGGIGSDDYYLEDASWAGLNERNRNFYLLQKFDDIGGEWSAPYNAILYTNIILETLNNLKTENQHKYNEIKGSALFMRAFNHFCLSQIFCLPYNEGTAKKDIGIALRLEPDLAVIPVRASVSDTYNSILTDLKKSLPLLPALPNLKYRASKASVYALMSRVYLSMRKYEEAGLYADLCLQLYSSLIDYNTINSSDNNPFIQFNSEVILDATTIPSTPLAANRARVDTLLYDSYDLNDLRKSVFFKQNSNGTIAFKGSYAGNNSSSLFTGLTTDEMYLIRAESEARKGNIAKANKDLNTLLINRWKTGTFIPFTSQNRNEVLRKILSERRKELLFRTLRWTDMRRLNEEPEFAQTFYRKIDGKEYILEPGSSRYLFQIDRRAIEISGMQQNP